MSLERASSCTLRFHVLLFAAPGTARGGFYRAGDMAVASRGLVYADSPAGCLPRRATVTRERIVGAHWQGRTHAGRL
jgi:hypothetical protein